MSVPKPPSPQAITDPCPVEAVFGPDDRVPCILERGHEPPHQYAPEPCGQCGCLPGEPWGCGCTNPGCPCSEEEDEEPIKVRFAPGRRVRFAHPDAGYPADQRQAAELLTPGEVYTIAWSDIGFSSSRVGLAGVESGLGFNSVLFEPAEDATETGTTATETGKEQAT